MTFSEWYGSDLTGQTYDGFLNCSGALLTSLKGCPKVVNGDFDCDNNNLESLEHGPKMVKGSLFCNHNKLTTLKHGPKLVVGMYYCYNNKLTSLNGLCYAEHIISDFSKEEEQEYLMEHYPEMMI